MYILGISGGVRQGNQDAAACLLKDGQIVAAAEEERFNRVKHAAGYLPQRAVKFCLKQAGIRLQDVDVLVFPGETYTNFETILRRFFEAQFGYCPPVQLVNHHVAHAASAYRTSGFNESSIITFDLSGDGISTLVAHGKGSDINVLRTYRKPNSLGIFYSLLTQYLGFRRDSDEYKVMGLASYGKPEFDLSWLLKLSDDGYTFNTESMLPVPPGASNPSKQEPFYSDRFLEEYNRVRLPDGDIDSYHENFAASGQKLLEDIAVHLAEQVVKETGSRNLCLAGGVALNCVMVGVLSRQSFVDNVYVPPAASDAGLAMGAALEVAAERGHTDFPQLQTAALGSSYGADDIKETLELLQSPYEMVDDPAARAAQDAADGKIVGWFSGRMEYGPRALGSRSIVADPRRAEMKDILNERVKFRETFRPFAPAVLLEHADDYFEHAFESPYMTVTFDVKADKQEVIPAVTHVDGTARIQTVSEANHAQFRRLIEQFYEITGVPVVINTSFNLKGQPIVENPQQAIMTFYGCGMDVLYIENFRVAKPGC